MGEFFIVFGLVMFLIVGLSDLVLPSRSFELSHSRILGVLPSIATIFIGIAIVRLRARTRQVLATLVLVAIGGITALSAAALGVAVLEPGVGFRYDRTTGPSSIYDRVVSRVGLLGTGVCRCAPDSEARIVLPGDFETHTSIYDNGEPGPRPGVVVVHGNTWLGGNLSTYRLLASRLAAEGYIVLSFDFPGFGRSDDPFGQGPSSVAAAWNRTGQVDAAIDYLIKNTNVDRSNISVFGHSGGVAWAMRTGVSNSRVSKVAVMVAPPPAKYVNKAEKRSAYFSRRSAQQFRFVYGKERPEWYRWELTRMDERYNDDPWTAYTKPGHLPILLILGERDEPSGHKSVLSKFDLVFGPKKFVQLDGSDHYLNTAQSLSLVFYDKGLAHQLTRAMVSWIEFAAGPRD